MLSRGVGEYSPGEGGRKEILVHFRGEACPGAGDVLAEGFYAGGFGPDGAVCVEAVNLFQ